MTLPTVSEFGRFDRFNACMCIVAFAANISPEEQQRLNRLTDGHNTTSPGNASKPRFRLVFAEDMIQFWRVAATDAPTREQFGALLEALGIANPGEAKIEAKPAATTPKTASDDAQRAV
jgi:hypothetical protein